MHKQIRTVPARSPADLLEFLYVLANAGIDMRSAGGSNIEEDGTFAFTVAHGKEQEAMDLLASEGYHPELVDVDEFTIEVEGAGKLLEVVTQVRASNLTAGRVIRDITMGAPSRDGRTVVVQIYSVEAP